MSSIPMLDLAAEYEYMKPAIDEAIQQTLKHQRWIMGPEVKALENKLQDYLSANHCIGVASGTDALVLSLRALAIQLTGHEYFERDHEILTTPFTFTATGGAILRAGAQPTFIDICPKTYNIDVSKLRQYLQNNADNVVGIIPVHLYGQACNMDEILALAKEYNLFVLEDVAQAFGASWEDKKLGNVGTLGAFSFFPSKNLGGFGDGGLIATRSDELSELVRMLLKHGGQDKYNVDHIGYNSRLDTLQAGVLLAKLQYIDEFNNKRRHIAAAYDDAFNEIELITTPHTHEKAHHVFHQYTLNVGDYRDDLQKYLSDKQIASMVYYPVPLHQMKVFADGRCKQADSLEFATKASEHVLSLPIEPLQTEADTMRVCDAVKAFFNEKI